MNSKNIFPKILKQGLNDEGVYEIIYNEEQERDQLIMIIHYFDNFLNYLDTEMTIVHQRYIHKATQVSAGDFRHQYFWGDVGDPKYVQGINILSYTPNPQKKALWDAIRNSFKNREQRFKYKEDNADGKEYSVPVQYLVKDSSPEVINSLPSSTRKKTKHPEPTPGSISLF